LTVMSTHSQSRSHLLSRPSHPAKSSPHLSIALETSSNNRVTEPSHSDSRNINVLSKRQRRLLPFDNVEAPSTRSVSEMQLRERVNTLEEQLSRIAAATGVPVPSDELPPAYNAS
jgi:hypothetical protein